MKAKLDSIASLFSLAVLLAWLSIIPTAYATTYTTVAAGDWTSSSTWEGGLIHNKYLSGDVVNINHRVNYPNSLGDLLIQNGTLNVHNILLRIASVAGAV